MTAIKLSIKQFHKKHTGYIIKNFSLFWLMCLCLNMYGQKNETDNIKDLFNNYREHHFQEKIYLHTDKSFYVTSEILWCKAYVADAHLHHSSDLSKTAYLELIDANNNAVWQSSFGIENGKGEASLVIPSSITTGNYTLRCYTNWMKNLDASYFYEKLITIINPLKKAFVKSTDKSPKILVDFFPEGGHLVFGLESLLAIKATDEYGKGIRLKGVLKISGSDTILRFETNEYGLGKCSFKPTENNNYEAWIQQPGNDWQLVNLPEITDQGYNMHLDDTDPEIISISVSLNQSSPESNCYLFVHCRQTFIQAVSAKYKNGIATFKLPKSGITEGISHFTVFNENRQPVMERLYFKNPERLLQIKVSSNKEIYKIREKVTLDIESMIPGGMLSDASLSASIIKLDSNQFYFPDNIVQYFYLQSDIPGRIESPASYFSKESAEMADLLMLTYGWRRFNWKEILHNATPSFDFLPEYSGHIISGKVLDKNRQAVGAGKTGYASIPGNRYQMGISRTNENGAIQFPFTQNAGTAILALQPDYKNDSTLQVDWQSSFSKNQSGNKIPSFGLPEKSEAVMLEMINNVQLHQAYSGEKLNSFIPPDISDTTAFFGLPDKNYFLDNYTRFSTMEEVFTEFIPEVEVRKSKNNYRLMVNNLPYKSFFKEEPLMLLDGVPFTDVNKVMQFDPLKIKNIGIVARRYYVSGLTYPGMISFETYNGDLSGISLDPHVLLVDYEGIQVKREFYSPQYSTDKEVQNRLPDMRRLLYWAPNINTGVSGKTSLSFFTADLPGKYAIIVEGMQDKGFVGSSLTYFEVK